jgi:hypothetical protein
MTPVSGRDVVVRSSLEGASYLRAAGGEVGLRATPVSEIVPAMKRSAIPSRQTMHSVSSISERLSCDASFLQKRIVGFVNQRSDGSAKRCPISVPSGLHEVTSYRLA